MQEAVIVATGRSAVGKANKGALRHTRPDDMAAQVIKEVLERAHPLESDQVEDVILGCAFPEAEQGMNVARIASFRAGLPDHTSAMTINRFCSSGLQTIALATSSIRTGTNEVVIAGGTESMSLVPMQGDRFSPNPTLLDERPEVYLSMGLTTENLAAQHHIARELQDEFSLGSHRKALQAQNCHHFDRELIPLRVTVDPVNDGPKPSQVVEFKVDEGPRAETSMEALSQLEPVFKTDGTLTAGNSSQRSDGAAALVVLSERKARDLSLAPLGRLVSFATAGVAPEIMGIGPVFAIPKALKLAGLKLDDIGLIELNEAFAAQALAVIQQAGLNADIVNVNGGAIALGHPLGCTGAKLTVTILAEMERRGIRYGLVTMCVGGGMGAAGVFECYRA